MVSTISNFITPEFKKLQDTNKKNKLKKTPKQECEEKGGFWDEKNQTCLLYERPNEQPKVENPKVNPPKGTVETFSSSKTGRASGVTTSTGQTFLGLSPGDVNTIAAQESSKFARPEGSEPAGTAKAEANRQARLQQLMQLGEQGVLSPQELQAIQEAPIDWEQALTAGTVGNLPSVLTRAATGAAAGFVGAAPISTALASTGIGAIPAGIIAGGAALLGAISAIWSGTQSNIKSQQKGEINSAVDVLNAAKTNIRQLRMIAEQDPTKAEEAIKLYYDQIAQVRKAHRKVQLETQGNLNKFMEDGTDILSDFELFLQPGGYADLQKIRLEQAVSRGTPATPEQLLQVYQEEYDTNE